jgi:hypothetical protein
MFLDCYTVVVVDVSEVHPASIFRVEVCQLEQVQKEKFPERQKGYQSSPSASTCMHFWAFISLKIVTDDSSLVPFSYWKFDHMIIHLLKFTLFQTL